MSTISDKFKLVRRIIAGIYQADPSEVSDGDPVSLNLDSTGRVKVSCTPFDPENGTGQTVSFTDTADRSTQLTVGSRYWVWSTQSCYLAFGDSSIVATTSDFRFPVGAVIEYIPTTDRDYISALRMTTSGDLYLAVSAQ